MLSARKEALLRLIIGEYVDTAQPVGSEAIVRKYALELSPATVRNEMAELEEQGYITHPHTSAGRVPSAKGYRYYIDHLMDPPRLPVEDQYRILHQFHQVEMELEEWARLAAALLARLVENVAVVTAPKPPACRLKRFHLLSVHDQRGWLVMVLHGGTLKQSLLNFDVPTTQDDLDIAANRLNPVFRELTAQEILDRSPILTDLEDRIVRALVRVMQGVDQQSHQDPWLEGLYALLRQPEFDQPQRMRRALELLSERSSLVDVLPLWERVDRVQISIGEENAREELQDLSLVASPYGIPGEVGGMVAVLGPTRMRYNRAVSAACYLAAVMSELLRELHG